LKSKIFIVVYIFYCENDFLKSTRARWRSASVSDSRSRDPGLGALKMLDVKMTDVKLTDQCAGHEIAGHEIARHENAGMK